MITTRNQQLLPAIVMSVICAIALPCFGQADTTPILQIIPSKAEIIVGEPCVLKVRLQNTADAPLDVDLGADRIGAFSVDVTDVSSNALCAKSRIVVRGVSRLGRVEIRPRESYEDTVILNRWCNSPLQAGLYRIHWSVLLPDQALEASAEVSVVTDSGDDLTEVLDEIKRDIFSGGLSVEQARFQTELLGYFSSDKAIPYLVAVLRDGDVLVQRPLALRGLQHIGTIQSVESLAEVASDTSTPTHIQRDAWDAIVEIQKRTTKEDVRARCLDLQQSVPREALKPIKPDPRVDKDGR